MDSEMVPSICNGAGDGYILWWMPVTLSGVISLLPLRRQRWQGQRRRRASCRTVEEAAAGWGPERTGRMLASQWMPHLSPFQTCAPVLSLSMASCCMTLEVLACKKVRVETGCRRNLTGRDGVEAGASC